LNIALLGATSHVAKSLIRHIDRKIFRLSLYARDLKKLSDWLATSGIEHIEEFDLCSLKAFPEGKKFDGIVNCIGYGTPTKVRAAGVELFLLTEHWDNIVLQYLIENRSCIYVNFSSGAVYGTDHTSPIDESSLFDMKLNPIEDKQFYRVAKLASEAKHRACAQYSIWDIRLFSFFSRDIDVSSTYLLTDMVNAVQKRTPFVTNRTEVIRDYIHPKDLTKLVQSCLRNPNHNGSIDTRSLLPITKTELIDLFVRNFQMEVKIDGKEIEVSPTGTKAVYYSVNKNWDSVLGWSPTYTSEQAVLEEVKFLFVG